jgi:hypothetical protein
VSKSKANKMGMAVWGQQKNGVHVERRGEQAFRNGSPSKSSRERDAEAGAVT